MFVFLRRLFRCRTCADSDSVDTQPTIKVDSAAPPEPEEPKTPLSEQIADAKSRTPPPGPATEEDPERGPRVLEH